MKEENLVLVKLGGSVITDKTEPYTEDKEVIDRLSSEIKSALEKKPDLNIVVGHGGGSYPHHSASKYQTHKGIIDEDSYEGIAKVQDDAARLNRIVVSSFIDRGLPAISIQPSASCVASDGEIHDWDLSSLKKALELGLIPVPYGDVALDHEKGCCILSTEKLLSYISREVGGDKLILCGNVDGVFDSDPSQNPNAELIEKITPENFDEIKDYLTGSEGEDVTGGMPHKVKRCLRLAERGIDSYIVNGKREGILRKGLLGKDIPGTLVTSSD